MKLKKNIYNTFGCIQITKINSLNDIIKGTKSVIASKNGFKNYINNYTKLTKISSFKSPDTTEYPILRKKYSYLVPVKKVNNNNKSEDIIIKNKNKEKKLNLFSNIFENEHKIYLEKYNKRFNKFLRLQTESKNMKILKKEYMKKDLKDITHYFLIFLIYGMIVK